MPVGSIHRRCIVIFFSYFSVVSVLYLSSKTTRANVIVTLKISGRMEQSGRISCRFQVGWQLQMRKVSRCCHSIMTDSERLCVRAFFLSFLFSKPGGFSVELYWKSIALNTGLGMRPLLLNPLNISILARHPMPACWHIDWRTLACLPIIPCKQPSVSPCTSII